MNGAAISRIAPENPSLAAIGMRYFSVKSFRLRLTISLARASVLRSPAWPIADRSASHRNTAVRTLRALPAPPQRLPLPCLAHRRPICQPQKYRRQNIGRAPLPEPVFGIGGRGTD